MKKWGAHRGSVPTINQIIALETTVRLGSFSAAATEILLTQGAVAQQVRELEKELGANLFDRTSRGLSPTKECIEYIDSLKSSLDTIEKATLQFQRHYSLENQNKVTLSTSPSFASRWLIPHLPSFKHLNPDVSLVIETSDNVRSFQGDDRIDLAIRWASPPFPGFKAHFLSSGNLIPVCSPQFADENPDMTLDNLFNYPLICDSHASWKLWFDYYGDSSSKIEGPIFSQTSHALKAAQQGMGIALAPKVLVTDAILSNHLVAAINSKHELTTQTAFYIITAEQPLLQSATDKVVQWLLQEASPVEHLP